MIITLVLVLSLFLIALAAAEVLFRSGQAGLFVLGFFFGFRYFRPDEMPRMPFYLLTAAAATILSIVAVIVSIAIT